MWARWKTRRCFTSGLYTIQNLGSPDVGLGDSEFVEAVSGVSESPSDKLFIGTLGMELDIADELDVTQGLQLTTGGRERP